MFPKVLRLRHAKCMSAWLFAILAACCLVSPLAAQINTGKITGFVTDSGGAFIAGAAVRAVNEQTGVATSVATQDNGSYLDQFPNPRPVHSRGGIKRICQ